jgi:hypothetical protein
MSDPVNVSFYIFQEDLLQFVIDVSKGSDANRTFAYSYLLGLKCESNVDMLATAASVNNVSSG